MSQEMQITVLIENTSDGSLACEHGLSLYIEHDGKKILLDAGSTEAFSDNADALGISLVGLDAYVLSHGHYDHSGGFEKVFFRDPAGKSVLFPTKRWMLSVMLSFRKALNRFIPGIVPARRDLKSSATVWETGYTGLPRVCGFTCKNVTSPYL